MLGSKFNGYFLRKRFLAKTSSFEQFNILVAVENVGTKVKLILLGKSTLAKTSGFISSMFPLNDYQAGV